MELDQYNQIPTHTIHPGARIKVETKTGRGFAWATSESEFEVALQLKELEPHREKEMGLFLAMSAFTACFPQHEYRKVLYDTFTRLYAFKNPEDRLVTRLPKPKNTTK